MADRTEITFSLTRGEAQALHEQIGDINQLYVGPKLKELYRRLDAVLMQDWSKIDRTSKVRA